MLLKSTYAVPLHTMFSTNQHHQKRPLVILHYIKFKVKNAKALRTTLTIWKLWKRRQE